MDGNVHSLESHLLRDDPSPPTSGEREEPSDAKGKDAKRQAKEDKSAIRVPSCLKGMAKVCKAAGLLLALNLPKFLLDPFVKRALGDMVSKEGVRIDRQTLVLLHLQRRLFRTTGEILHEDVARGRRMINRVLRQPRKPDVRIQGLALDGPEGEIPARVYTPDVASPGKMPVLVYYHGGGWVVGNLDTVDGLMTWLASLARVVVVSVDYRLAPEHRYPAAAEDAVAAYRWVVSEARGGDRGWDSGRIAVGGDSAGGNLAAVVCQHFAALQAKAERDGTKPEGNDAHHMMPVHQFLLFPALQIGDGCWPLTPSMEEFGPNPLLLLDEHTMKFFVRAYLVDATTQGLAPTASPVAASPEVLRRVPPAYLALCHFDPLRDEGRQYATMLARNGVRANIEDFRAHHGFIYQLGRLRYAAKSVEAIAGELRSVMWEGKDKGV